MKLDAILVALKEASGNGNISWEGISGGVETTLGVSKVRLREEAGEMACQSHADPATVKVVRYFLGIGTKDYLVGFRILDRRPQYGVQVTPKLHPEVSLETSTLFQQIYGPAVEQVESNALIEIQALEGSLKTKRKQRVLSPR